MTEPKGSPRRGAASEASGGGRVGEGWGRNEEAGPVCKRRTRKESPIFNVSRETISRGV